MENFFKYFIPLLQQLFLVLLIILGISTAYAFAENLRLPGRIAPLEIEYMGIKFRGRRLLIGLISAALLQVLILILNFLVQDFWGGPGFLLFYLILLSLGAGVFVYTLDQLIFLSGVAGVYFSNLFKGKDA